MTGVQILIVTVLLQQGFFGVLWLGAAWLRMAPRAALHWSATTMLLGLSMASLIGHDALDPAVGHRPPPFDGPGEHLRQSGGLHGDDHVRVEPGMLHAHGRLPPFQHHPQRHLLGRGVVELHHDPSRIAACGRQRLLKRGNRRTRARGYRF